MSFGYVNVTGDVVRITRARDFKPMKANARLSVDDVQQICADIAESRIDPVLDSLGYVLPVDPTTSPRGWKVLSQINVLGAACRIDQVNFTEAKPSAAKENAEWTCTEFEKQLKLLSDGLLELVDVDQGLDADAMTGDFFYSEEPYFGGMDDKF